MFDTADEVTSKYRAIEPVGIRYFLLAMKAIILRAFDGELFRPFLLISFISIPNCRQMSSVIFSTLSIESIGRCNLAVHLILRDYGFIAILK